MEEQIRKILLHKDKVLLNGNLAILCNQISYSFLENQYLFEILAKTRNLKRIFVPEHGLFAELQDQIKLNDNEIYKDLGLRTQFVSLYSSKKFQSDVYEGLFNDIDLLIIDIQDVGSRYYTFISTIYEIFKAIKIHNRTIDIFVIDRPNPAGRSIEGTMMPKKYASFLGVEGLPHRHGLSIGELCRYFIAELNAAFRLEVICYDANNKLDWQINPSPNIPNTITPKIYSGQCLFEGTKLSEGRGTTRPFEIVGAPRLTWQVLEKIESGMQLFLKTMPDIKLRKTRFLPTFHKFANQTCFGFQIHVFGDKFHALEFSCNLIRLIAENVDFNIWRDGVYESDSNYSAMELLAGDDTILDFLRGVIPFNFVKEKMVYHENLWRNKTKEFLLYSV